MVMITGDNRLTAAVIAAKAGVDDTPSNASSAFWTHVNVLELNLALDAVRGRSP